MFAHMGHYGAAADESSVQVYIYHTSKYLHGIFPCFVDATSYSSVVAKHINLPQLTDCGLRGGSNRIFIG